MRKRWLAALLSGILLLTGVSSSLALDTKHKPSIEERVRGNPPSLSPAPTERKRAAGTSPRKLSRSLLCMDTGGIGEKIVPFLLLNKCYNRDSSVPQAGKGFCLGLI